MYEGSIILYKKDTINIFYFICYFRSPSRDSTEGVRYNEEDEIRNHQLASSDVSTSTLKEGIDEDTFLAHLESQMHSEESISPQT